MEALTLIDIINFQQPRRRRPQYLALENGAISYLDDEHIAKGTPLPYNHVTTENGTEAYILLTQNSITADDGWNAELDDNGTISRDAAATIAQSINDTSGISLTLAIERAQELAVIAEHAAAEAQSAALARASAVARVVNLCGGSQTEAARQLGIGQPRVSRLVAKASALKQGVQNMATSAASARDAVVLMQSALRAPDVD